MRNGKVDIFRTAKYAINPAEFVFIREIRC
jgi:hypothetical protein